MQKQAKQMHQEVLDLIQSLADGTSSDGASLMSRAFSRSENSSSSLPMMLPSEPQIFHGRELELSHIITDFAQQGQIAPRIAILGTGGMGKTSLARAVLHHEQIVLRYNQHRVFVSCDSAFTAAELAGLIGSHLGLQTGKNAVQEIITHLIGNPACLLILDNLETVWEPTKSRGDIEELLSLLSGVNHLALIITMRGAERPAKVGWSHPFLPPLKSLGQDAARQTFFDIADGDHDSDEVDKILLLTDNMPLAISLIAHAVDSESCSDVLSRWEEEKTSLISEGHDQRSNLDFSISLSLTSPRLTSVLNAQDLLSLLSILPDGLGDSELLQIQFPIENILACKTTLLRTSLAYSDEHNRLKSLMPIREYMQKFSPPASSLVEPLLMHFLELLELYHTYSGTVSSSGLVPRVVGNFSNIQNILRMGLRKDNPDLVNTIYCTCYLDLFSIHTGRGAIPFFNLVPDLLPRPQNYRLEVFFLTQQLYPWRYHQINNPEVLIEQALTYLPHFSDSDVQCKFHNILGGYHWRHKNNIPMATDCFQAGLSLAISTSNTPRQSVAMSNLAHVQVLLGNYTTARTQAHEAQRLAKICGDLLREAMALQIEAVCLYTLGDYKQSLSLCQRARNVLNLCGMAGHGMDNDMMNQQAQIHQLKSEYAEAREIRLVLLKKVSVEKEPYQHAWALMGIAEIEVQMNLPTQDVQAKIDAAKSIFSTVGDSKTAVQCDTVLADLYLRDGKLSSAKELFEKCLKLCQGQGDGIATECLQRLGNGRRWGSPNWTFNWTIIFLAQSSKSKQKLGVYQAMQYLGDVFDLDGDYETAVNTITVALEADIIDGPGYSDDSDDNPGSSGSDDDYDTGSDLGPEDGWSVPNHFPKRPTHFGTASPDEKGFHPTDLRNPKYFPAYEHCAPYEIYDFRDWDNELEPPPHHWCFIGQLVGNAFGANARMAATVKDKNNKEILVTFRFDRSADFDHDSVAINYTISVLYAEQHTYGDGRVGLRLEHPQFIKVFPVSPEILLDINDEIENESPTDRTQKCKACRKEDPDPTKITLLRCSRCFGVSYCSKECQVADWKQFHKGECSIYKALVQLKQSRDWGMPSPPKWIAWGEQEETREPVYELSPCPYQFDLAWKDAEPAVMAKLQGSFTVTSGVLIWGGLHSLLDGMMTKEHDTLPPSNKTAFRAAAKNGIWKLAKVNGYGEAEEPKDSWIAYHSSYESPLEPLLLARSAKSELSGEYPRAYWVPRNDYDLKPSDDLHAARLFSDLEPTLGWGAAMERHKRLRAVHKNERPGHPDYAKWVRLERFGSKDSVFLVDAAKGAGVAKLIAGNGKLETDDPAASFLSNDIPAGCSFKFTGDKWEAACLIFGEQPSPIFSGEKELVAFWYDTDATYNEGGWDAERTFDGDPVFEIVYLKPHPNIPPASTAAAACMLQLNWIKGTTDRTQFHPRFFLLPYFPMRAFFASLAGGILLVSVNLATAQDGTNDGGLSPQQQCTLNCSLAAVDASGCPGQDTVCICASTVYTASFRQLPRGSAGLNLRIQSIPPNWYRYQHRFPYFPFCSGFNHSLRSSVHNWLGIQRRFQSFQFNLLLHHIFVHQGELRSSALAVSSTLASRFFLQMRALLASLASGIALVFVSANVVNSTAQNNILSPTQQCFLTRPLAATETGRCQCDVKHTAGKCASSVFATDVTQCTTTTCGLSDTQKWGRYVETAALEQEHLDVVLAAATTTISILRLNNFPAPFSEASHASFMAITDAHRYDADILVLPPSDLDDAVEPEMLKRLIVAAAPGSFYLKDARDPAATYQTLWFQHPFHRGRRETKVDILVPGRMSLPAIPISRIRWSHNNLPLVPFPFLLLHKLKGWADRRDAPEGYKRARHYNDAADVLGLLDLGAEMCALQAQPSWWKDTELFDPEMQADSIIRVEQFCATYPESTERWRALGFEVQEPELGSR
ncbi:hypothetical protein C8R43DRAFT_1116782 [Mycena crocata]|nr:hypothetical protein C8R43DRAFT_1116782 [Mycena crocata]